MPQLGETVSEGTVIRWLHRPGDAIAADAPLVEIQTDKVSMEVPSLCAGVLAEILVEEGQTVPVGAALAWLETSGQDAGSVEAPSAESPAHTQASSAADADAAPPAAAAAAPDERRPSPLIRRLLSEAGLTAADVVGTGPGGRILREDVGAAVAARAAPGANAPPPSRSPDVVTPAPATRVIPDGEGTAPVRGRTEPLSPVRKLIAQRMTASLRTSAQLTSFVEVDVTRIALLRARALAEGTAGAARLSFLPFFARAAIEALEAHPDLNASVDSEAETVTHHDGVHLGIAVDTDGGLLVPVIRNADRLSTVGLAHAITDIAERARAGRITADELSGGTFTISNTGSRGALFDTPIINQPQVGILATGAVVRRPSVVVDPAGGTEGIAIRSMMFLALTYDHRLVDGATAARFLVAMQSRLEQGLFDAELGLSQH